MRFVAVNMQIFIIWCRVYDKAKCRSLHVFSHHSGTSVFDTDVQFFVWSEDFLVVVETIALILVAAK